MGVLAKDNRQLIFIYSESALISQRLLHSVKVVDKRIRLINIDKESISDTIWIEIAAMLNRDFDDLFTLKRLDDSEVNTSSKFSVGDWLKMISQNPSILKNPIAINGSKASVIKEKHQILSFFNTTGANFDKSVSAIQLAKHKDTTGYKSAM